ncbi:MAG TPA: DUF2306 domain-containing protein [Dokdonella sp.]
MTISPPVPSALAIDRAAVGVPPRAPAAAPRRDDPFAARALRATAALWLAIAVGGQLLFAGYVAGFYGRAAVQRRPEALNTVMPHGYVAGASFTNAVVVLHLAFAVAIVLAGAMQLTPALRRRRPELHRWIGRGYLVAAAVMSIGGLIMVWVRGAVGDLSQHVAISVNALLILAFAAIAWRHARARRLDAHRRWALRLFLTVSGVWFFRIGLMFWVLVNGGPAGFDERTFTGPALSILGITQYVLPLAVLELYFRAQARGSARSQLAVAALIGLLTPPTLIGIGAAVMFMWLPRL